jgi:hypothetical protein
MTKQPRPRHQKKGDRLLDRAAQQTEVECDKAVAVMDRLAIQMDEKWGVDRLPELVSVETAQRYGSALTKLNAALEGGDPAEVAKRAQVCMRGLKVMNDEAEAAGQPQASAAYWEYELDGFKFGILKDDAHWMICRDARPDLRFFTMREIGVALKALRIDNPIFAEVKRHFPQAQIDSIAERAAPPQLDDPIPFNTEETD